MTTENETDHFATETDDGHEIGLEDNGLLWLNTCCGRDGVQLTVEQAIRLRKVINTFLSRNGVHRS